MRVATKLRAAFAAHLALLVAVLAFHVRGTRRAMESDNALSEIAARQRMLGDVQLERLTQMSADAEKFLVTRERGYLDRLVAGTRAFSVELARLDPASLSNEERARLAPLAAGWADVAARVQRLAADTVAPTAHDNARLQEGIDRVSAATERLREATQSAMTRKLSESKRAATAAERASWMVFAGAVLLSVLLFAALELSAVARHFNVMAERLGELDRLKRDFVANVSHDLKTPLSSVRETTDVLLDELAGPLSDRQRRLLRLNQDSGRRLASMVAKLLDLASLEARGAPAFEELDVVQLAHHAIARANAGRSEAGLGPSVVMDESPRTMSLRGDTESLERLLDNLLENAVKFTPPDGTIRVSVGAVAHDGGSALVTVADEGPGIPDDDKTRVFDRFHQTAAGRAARSRGIGLGLSICRHIAAAHGGRIWVTDNTPRGSVFHVQMPSLVAAR